MSKFDNLLIAVVVLAIIVACTTVIVVLINQGSTTRKQDAQARIVCIEQGGIWTQVGGAAKGCVWSSKLGPEK